MKTLRKDNIVLREADESKVKELLIQGFKLVGEDGNIIEDEKEKTVPLTEFNKLKDENKKLKKDNDVLAKRVEELEAEQSEQKKDEAPPKK